ncbi:MAG: fibrobacter succinogenes major paralogous domain-containing protein [Prevotellaceae bacterium]|nr:fibrobacter succinogenes major paralogous domain-containing protein [Prevotellaceae bacterium]
MKIFSPEVTNGIKFTDMASGKSIFFPAVGCRSIFDGALIVVSSYGYYWSSTPSDSDSRRANRLALCINYVNLYHNTFRKQGFSIRCVADR